RHGIDKLDLSQVGITKFDDLIIEKANRFTINGLSQIHGVSVKSKAPVAGSEPVELVYIDAIDPGDARWSEFRVWQDANQDGVADPAELRSMEEAGINLLSLLPTKNATEFSDGSSITSTSHADMRDGSRTLVGDVGLAYRSSSRR